MSFWKRCLFLIMVIGCSFFDSASSLQCYECTESEPKSCGMQFNPNGVTVTNCQNSIYTVDDNADLNKIYACLFIKETDILLNNSTYTRRCSIKNLADTCENIVLRNQATGNIRTSCIQCEKDLCNSSSLLKRNFVLIIFVVSFVVLRVRCSFW